MMLSAFPQVFSHHRGRWQPQLDCSLGSSHSLLEAVLMRWMKLEPIIQSEVSQKDKDHYSILTHIYGI